MVSSADLDPVKVGVAYAITFGLPLAIGAAGEVADAIKGKGADLKAQQALSLHAREAHGPAKPADRDQQFAQPSRRLRNS